MSTPKFYFNGLNIRMADELNEQQELAADDCSNDESASPLRKIRIKIEDASDDDEIEQDQNFATRDTAPAGSYNGNASISQHLQYQVNDLSLKYEHVQQQLNELSIKYLGLQKLVEKSMTMLSEDSRCFEIYKFDPYVIKGEYKVYYDSRREIIDLKKIFDAYCGIPQNKVIDARASELILKFVKYTYETVFGKDLAQQYASVKTSVREKKYKKIDYSFNQGLTALLCEGFCLSSNWQELSHADIKFRDSIARKVDTYSKQTLCYLRGKKEGCD